jgi:peptidyl-prolyl cis-trans isomerase SurA
MMWTTAPRGGISRGTPRGAAFARIGRGFRRTLAGAALALTALGLTAPASAQGQFAPVARIDGEVITSYELTQRTAFLRVLNAPGDVRAMALDQLINERLQLREAAIAGIKIEDEAVVAGMDEFAQRGGLDGEQMLQFLAQAGVGSETFRDFVRAGVIWREFSREVFLPRVSISNDEIEQAMARAEAEAGIRVLMSEIVLPAGDAATRKASKARAARLTGLDEAAFEAAAKRFSAGASRNNGGRMNWVDVTVLPPDVGAAVRGLRVGQTSRIIESADALRIYFLRDKEEVRGGTPATMIDYAALLLPGGNTAANLAEVQSIRDRVTSCDDLYPLARGMPPEQLVREEVLESQVPAAYRATIDGLDRFEVGSAVTPSGSFAVVMLCNRGNELPRSLTKDMVAEQLKNRRIGTMSQLFLEELRANASLEIIGN